MNSLQIKLHKINNTNNACDKFTCRWRSYVNLKELIPGNLRELIRIPFSHVEVMIKRGDNNIFRVPVDVNWNKKQSYYYYPKSYTERIMYGNIIIIIIIILLLLLSQ